MPISISRGPLRPLSRRIRFWKQYGTSPYGVLVGYSLSGSEGIVITDAIGPGQCATHGRTCFVPDCLYHELEIGRLYEESGRLHTYLGDWHTHPYSSTKLSLTDRRTQVTIAKHSEARVRTPVMVVVGKDEPPLFRIWQYYPPRLFANPRGKVVPLQVHLFS